MFRNPGNGSTVLLFSCLSCHLSHLHKRCGAKGMVAMVLMLLLTAVLMAVSHDRSVYDLHFNSRNRHHYHTGSPPSSVIRTQDDPLQQFPTLQLWQVMAQLTATEVGSPVSSLKYPKSPPVVSQISFSFHLRPSDVITLSALVKDQSGAGIASVYFYTSYPDQYSLCASAPSPFAASLTGGNPYYGYWTFTCKLSSTAINGNYTLQQVQAGDWNGNFGSGGSLLSFQVQGGSDGGASSNSGDAPVIKALTLTPAAAAVRVGDTLTMTAAVTQAGGPGVSYVLFSFSNGAVCVNGGTVVGALTAGTNLNGNYTASCTVASTASRTVAHGLTATATDAAGTSSAAVSASTAATVLPALATSVGRAALQAQGRTACALATAWPGLARAALGAAAWKAGSPCLWVVGNYSAGARPSWCSWSGVGCDAASYTVTSLALAGGSSPTGSLSTGLGQLTSLTSLTINGAGALGALPSTLTALTALRSLVVGPAAGLTGTLPAAIGGLTALTALQLRGSSVSAALPASLSQLTQLRSLVITGNAAPTTAATLPAGLSALQALTMLVVNNANLAAVSPALSALTALQQVDLASNALVAWPSAAAGEPLAGCSAALVYLNLSHNSLAAWPAASTYTPLTSLVTLSLAYNSLALTVPATVTALTALQLLDIGHNKVTAVPAAAGLPASLNFLSLAANALTSTIPVALSGLTTLQYLLLHKNSLSRTVPQELSALTNLVALSLAANSLTSTLPAAVVALPYLKYVGFGGGNRIPTVAPTYVPTLAPTRQPTSQPSRQPTSRPTHPTGEQIVLRPSLFKSFFSPVQKSILQGNPHANRRVNLHANRRVNPRRNPATNRAYHRRGLPRSRQPICRRRSHFASPQRRWRGPHGSPRLCHLVGRPLRPPLRCRRGRHWHPRQRPATTPPRRQPGQVTSRRTSPAGLRADAPPSPRASPRGSRRVARRHARRRRASGPHGHRRWHRRWLPPSAQRPAPSPRPRPRSCRRTPPASLASRRRHRPRSAQRAQPPHRRYLRPAPRPPVNGTCRFISCYRISSMS